MDKVIILNLNGRAYHLAESGFAALRAYLDRAEIQLQSNPDREEILADLEQAIAEKCQSFLNAHKTVVTGPETDRIIQDMGPVRDTGVDDAEGPAPSPSKEQPEAKAGPRKKLYQIDEGAMVSGVCNGLAAYFNVEVTLIRVAFVLGAFITGAWMAWFLAYFVLVLLIPHADTPEERAAAHGVHFSAQGLIDQGKLNYKKIKDSGFWRNRWDSQRRYFEHGWRRSRANFQGGGRARHFAMRASSIFANLLKPFLILGTVAFSLAFAFAMISLILKGDFLGLRIPEGIPLWLSIIVLVLLFQMMIWPLYALRLVSDQTRNYPSAWASSLSQMAAWAFNIFLIWALYTHVPQVREFLQKLPSAFSAFIDSLRES